MKPTWVRAAASVPSSFTVMVPWCFSYGTRGVRKHDSRGHNKHKELWLGLRWPSYPVDDNSFRGHLGEISSLLEQVGQAHLLQVFNQVVVLLQLEPRQHHLSSPAGRGGVLASAES